MMIAKVEAGLFHTIAVSLDRRHVYACGQANHGQCGGFFEKPAHDAIITKLQPVPFPEDVEVESVECGESHTLVIAEPQGGTRQVYTWGSTVPGMEDACCLGHGENDQDEHRPRQLVLKDGTLVPVKGGVWRQASGGAQHSAFVLTPTPKAPQAELTLHPCAPLSHLALSKWASTTATSSRYNLRSRK
jgi:hypothetical protein